MRSLFLIIVLLAGCASQPSLLQQAIYLCHRDTDAITAGDPHVRRLVMQNCVASELSLATTPVADALYVGGAALYGFGTGYLGNAPFGAPNSIGPYGSLGPTWQSFNGYFQPTPQQQLDNMLVH